jgi:hypothetical protein
MAARYVDTANIVAQGQSFYTGLLPGSYEQQAGGAPRGGNVYGKGSGGTAGVTADRTASEAAGLSIGDYKAKAGPTPASIFKAGEDPSDTDRMVQAIKEGPDDPNISARGPAGGGNPAGGQGVGALIPGAPPGGAGGKPTAPTGGMGNPPKNQGGGVAKGAGTAVGIGVGAAVTANTGNPLLGKMAGTAAGAITEHGVGKMGEKLSESPIGQAVQGRASTRQQTRQSGVQQSATQQSIPFPNMPNSTNRSLNF